MAFSRAQSKIDAIATRIRHAKIRAKTNPSFRLLHLAESRDADKGQFTLLIKRVTEEVQLKQLRNEKFQEKLHDTN